MRIEDIVDIIRIFYRSNPGVKVEVVPEFVKPKGNKVFYHPLNGIGIWELSAALGCIGLHLDADHINARENLYILVWLP